MKNLVQRALQNDQSAWAELYEKTYRETYFVAKKVLGNEDDAVDMVQDTYITAFEKLDQLNDSERFQKWLNMIVANKCKDLIKKKKPSLFTDLEREDGESPEWEDDRDNTVPEQIVDKQETVRLVQEIIGELPEDQKLCVIMYYREELGVGQIAQALEVSEGTVKSRLNYARQKIKAKVLELEKRGTKLYGVAPIPLLIWLLRSEADAAAAPAISFSLGTGAAVGGKASLAVGSEAAVVSSTSASSGSTAVSAGVETGLLTSSAGAVGVASNAGGVSVAAAANAALAGAKVLLGTTFGKVVAGIALVGVISGATIISEVQTSHESNEPGISMSVVLQDHNGNVIGGTTNADTVNEQVSHVELHAFDELRACGYTEDLLPINYYTYVDINQDDVLEMLVADQDWNSADEGSSTLIELLVWEDGKVKIVDRFCAYEPVYLINDQYLRFANKSDYYWSGTFFSLRDCFELKSPFKNGVPTDPKICFDGAGFRVYISSADNRDWVSISKDEFLRYLALPGSYTGSFALKAQVLKAIANETNNSSCYVETEAFTLTLPPSWQNVEIEYSKDGSITLYEPVSRAAGYGGFVLRIYSEPADGYVWRGYEGSGKILGTFMQKDGGEARVFLCYTPTDVQYCNEGAWYYRILTKDVNKIEEYISWDWVPAADN